MFISILINYRCNYIHSQECDLTKVTHPEKWLADLCLHLVYRTKPAERPGCLITEDLQTLHIPTNKKVEVWTQYRLRFDQYALQDNRH